jgi:hypothetical protein
MNGIEAQTVDMKFLKPVECVVEKELAYGAAALAIDIDPRAPRGFMPVCEERLGIDVQIISRGTEVVVDHIQEHHHAKGVSALHEPFEIVRRPVCGVGCERKNPVIAPIATTRKFSDRHEFDRRDAEIAEVL